MHLRHASDRSGGPGRDLTSALPVVRDTTENKHNKRKINISHATCNNRSKVRRKEERRIFFRLNTEISLHRDTGIHDHVLVGGDLSRLELMEEREVTVVDVILDRDIGDVNRDSCNRNRLSDNRIIDGVGFSVTLLLRCGPSCDHLAYSSYWMMVSGVSAGMETLLEVGAIGIGSVSRRSDVKGIFGRAGFRRPQETQGRKGTELCS